MRSIYEILAEIEACTIIDPETGEELGTDYERLKALDIERTEKLENVAALVKNLIAEREAVAAEIAKLTARKRTTDARIEGLKAYLFENLQGEHITSGRVKTGFHTTRDVVLIAENAVIPDEYMRVKTEVEPSKTALKAAIKSGAAIPGVTLIDKVTVTIK